jgi:hypothetical protein
VEHRGELRSRTVRLPTIGFRPLGGALIHSTLRDISCSGVGLARRGRLDLPIGTRVQVYFHLQSRDLHAFRSAEVRWCRFAGFNTYIGLRFETPLAPSDPLLADYGSGLL